MTARSKNQRVKNRKIKAEKLKGRELKKLQKIVNSGNVMEIVKSDVVEEKKLDEIKLVCISMLINKFKLIKCLFFLEKDGGHNQK